MSKSKMAVRTKTKDKSKQRKLDLTLVPKNKFSIRLFSLLLLFLGLSYLAVKGHDLWEQILPINEIELQGNTHFLQQRDIKEFMQQQSEQGMLAIDLQGLQSKAKNIDWVKNVEIRKVWPNKLVFIIDEHQPVAFMGEALLTQAGTKIEIAANSELVKDKKLIGLPTIIFAKSQQAHFKDTAFIWRKFRQLKREFEIVSLELNQLNIDDINNWELQFVNGMTLNLGRNERFERAERLVKVYQMIDNKNVIRNIDLRYHNGFAVEWLEKKV